MTDTTGPEVRVSVATGLTWEFVAPSSARTCSEQAEEIVRFTERLYDAFGEFLTPLEIRYEITRLEHDADLRPDGDAGESVIRELRNEAGISASEFVDSTALDEPGVRWLPRIPFERNRYTVHSEGTDYAIDRSDCTPYHDGEPRPGTAIPDPLEVVVTHRPASPAASVTTDHVLTVSVAMHSDHWLQRSADGEKNREYLAGFLSDVADAVPVESVHRDKYATSDFWNDLSVYSGDDDYIDLEPDAVY